MKVTIGTYSSDLLPVRRWEHTYSGWRHDKYYLAEEDYDWLDKIVMRFFDKLEDFVRPINRWNNQRKRKVKIHIDDYDVWSADHTLALIIHPVLIKLKEKKQGSPNVDDEDVPDYLKSTASPPKEEEYDIDNNHHARWEWVLDEMIWAFEQHADDNDDDIFHHNIDQLEMVTKPCVSFNYQKDPTKPAYWVDHEGKKKHHERKANGLRLFAKYYCSLWD